jgi:hypothetical protein
LNRGASSSRSASRTAWGPDIRAERAHQEEPRLAAGPVDVDQHLEEVDLGEIAGPIRQRHEDLAALPLTSRDRVFDDGHADAVPLGP